tara:strand:- start:10003 stop:10671 length:669 start_codon:yes stop_codon:yes gene_type:complete
MAKRMTDTDKWKKRFVRELSPQHKLLWFYILDDCNHAGIWEVDLEVASIRVGFDLSHNHLPSSFGEKVISFDNGDKWFIPEFIDFQYGELNPNSNVHKSVIALLDKYNLEGYLKGSQGVQSTLNNKDKDKDIVKVKAKVNRFVKPTIEEVADYCNERNNDVDAEKFYDYYSSNGWKVGKNAMKDWKASVRTWEKNTTQEQKASQPKQVLTSWQQARQQINNG